MNDSVRERIVRNNYTFREANEQIRARADEYDAPIERIPFLCECPVPSCTEVLRLTMASIQTCGRIRTTSSPSRGTSRQMRLSHMWFLVKRATSSSKRNRAFPNSRLPVAMSSREERIGLNEAVFREVNERIEGLAETFDLKTQSLDLICECGDANCVERLSMTTAEYEEIRSEAHQFAVHPGHEYPDVESVVARLKGYDIVRKNEGVPKQIAEQTDPRGN